MTDETQAGEGTGAGRDPWAPPEHRTSLEKQPQQPGVHNEPAAQQPTGQPPSVHDQVTVTSMPGGGFAPPGYGPPTAGTPTGTAPGGATLGGFPAPGGPDSAVPPPPIAPSGPGVAPGGYGYPGYPAGYGWPGMPMAPQNGMGIAAMVLGIISCGSFCMYGVLSVVTGVLAVIFGIKGRKRVERGVATNHGQALAGLITGIIGIVLGLAVIVVMIIGIKAAIDQDKRDSDSTYGAAPSTSVSVLVPGGR